MNSVALGSVATIERKGVDPYSVAPDTLYLGLEHIERGGRIIGHDTVAGAQLASTKFQFSAEHVLFGKLRPNLGKVSRPNFAGVCSTDILPIRPGKDLDRNYLAHYLAQPSMVDFAASRTSGANLPRLSPTVLATFQVPLPSVSEQRRIAAILDHTDALRAKRRHVLSHLEALPVAIYQSMFGDPAANPHGYPVASIRSLATKFSDGPFGSNLKSSHYRSDGIPVVRLQNIGVGRYLAAEKAFVSGAHYASLAKHDCQPGDVLIGTLGTPNLRACLQPPDMPIALNKADCIQFRVDDSRANATWACWLLNMPGTLARASALAHGQTRTRIAMGQLRELQVPVPPLALQNEFAEQMERIEAQLAAVGRALTADDELFATLQSRAFRGEL